MGHLRPCSPRATMPVEGVREGGLRAVVAADSSACPHLPMLISRSSAVMLATIVACAPAFVSAHGPAQGSVASSATTASPAVYDLLIRGGKIVDGTGSPWVRGDVAIRGDRIA